MKRRAGQRVFPTAEVPVPVPERLLLFSPHPDDVAISAGALAAWAAEAAIPTVVVLVTDGSEARIPSSVLATHGWTTTMSSSEQRALRGQVRTGEALEEVRRLGFGASALHRLRQQRWFERHQTEEEFLHPDQSLRDVTRFRPGAIDAAAVLEIQDLIGKGPEDHVICGVPDPRDRLMMHRIVTALVAEALLPLCSKRPERYGLLTYECLSTEQREEKGPWTYFGFGEELMSVKCHAILAHRSMQERRKQFGGYSNSGDEFYDSLVRRANRETAQRCGVRAVFAERYGWLDRPSPAALREMRRITGVAIE